MLVSILSLASCIALIYFLRGIAHRYGLVDHPGGRKRHEQPTPTVGGLAMFFAVLAAMAVNHSLRGNIAVLLGCAAALLMLGILDDKRGLSVSLRMLIQVFLVTVVIMGAGGEVTHLGAVFGRHDVLLGLFAVPFSVVAYVGGINAINMIDGADGMAGKMALITVLGVVSIFYFAGALELPMATAMLGALLGFLLFNSRFFVKRAWVFMGNAGSMWVGLVLGWFMAQITRGSISAEPALVLWLFGIPLIDTLAVMIRRMKHKRSPFDPDRTHIHHVFENQGLSINLSVIALSLVQLVLVSTGVLLYVIHAPAYVVFWSYILLLSAYCYGMRNYRYSLCEVTSRATNSRRNLLHPPLIPFIESSDHAD
jgi:UDP-GlcNAc:undecaprenyl-phosphate GlcNAc-1-phosphate transferase